MCIQWQAVTLPQRTKVFSIAFQQVSQNFIVKLHLQPTGKAVDNASKMIAEKHLLPFSGPVLHHEADSKTENEVVKSRDLYIPKVKHNFSVTVNLPLPDKL